LVTLSTLSEFSRHMTLTLYGGILRGSVEILLMTLVSLSSSDLVVDLWWPSDWSAEQVQKHHNRELRGLGNLYARIYTEDMCNTRVYAPPSVSSQDPLEKQLAESLLGAAGEVNQHMQSLELSKALDRIVQCLDLVWHLSKSIYVVLTSPQSNEYFSQQQIWKPANDHLKGPTLALTREALRIAATLLQPFLPERVPMLLDWIGVPEKQRSLMWATFGAVQSLRPRPRQVDQRLFETIKTA
jgi:methionyl-tRNA synthetase